MASAATVEADQRFASVWKIRGEVVAAGKDSAGNGRMLREGDTVHVGERIRATPTGEAVLKTLDGGAIAIRPGTEFLAEQFVAEGKPTDSSLIRIVTGSLRIISGWIGQVNRAGHRVQTPTATIGIRGTDHKPYVMLAEIAKKTSYKEGTYDKANRGMTALETGPYSLEIDAGRVGFARAPEFPPKKRALMAILMPVLLDKIPDFYVPGEFDADLDQFSEVADALSRRDLEKVGGSAAAQPPAPGAPEQKAPTAPLAAATTATPHAETPAGCSPATLGKAWVEALDNTIIRRDAQAIIAAFAPEAIIEASVRGKEDGMTTVELTRDQMAKSTITAMSSLEGYRHRRISMDATLASQRPNACDRIQVNSVVIEQGRQGGKPFRFESLEEYLLELRDGKWLAVRAKTTQR